MCLQAPIRRGEERFDLSEPAWIQDEGGARMLAHTVDLSLSGAALMLDTAPAKPIAIGQHLRVYLDDVGTIGGQAVRVRGESIGIRFDLPPSQECDRLIRKLFTGGLDTTAVTTSVWAATLGLIKRIWSVNAKIERPAEAEIALVKEEKLPARTLVLPPANRMRSPASKENARPLSAA